MNPHDTEIITQLIKKHPNIDVAIVTLIAADALELHKQRIKEDEDKRFRYRGYERPY